MKFITLLFYYLQYIFRVFTIRLYLHMWNWWKNFLYISVVNELGKHEQTFCAVAVFVETTGERKSEEEITSGCRNRSTIGCDTIFWHIWTSRTLDSNRWPWLRPLFRSNALLHYMYLCYNTSDTGVAVMHTIIFSQEINTQETSYR